MPVIKRNFIKGRMNKDADIRLLPKGEYRDLYGAEVINSEGSDVGAAEVMLSNKQLTSFDVGANPIDLGDFADEFRKKIYWFVLSDAGSYLFEWDDINQVQSLVLADTRPEETRVFSLNKDHLINGIVKVVTQEVEGDLLLFTDDNMQPICINIERAKTYGVNGFEEDDILLIKKPPRFALAITPTYTNDGSNNMEENFFLFAHRYRYLDGEYSAPSDFTNYFFTPQPFDLDYFTLDNLGMVNSFNAVKIDFNTGEKQVTEIQLLVKTSLSNTLYVIETFNKEQNGWSDNETQSFIFSNNKTLIPLPQDQLFRTFDNVPRLAKSLSLVENIPIFSNYIEGYNIKKEADDIVNINIDYSISLQNNVIETGDDFTITIPDPDSLQITNPNGFELNKGRILSINIQTEIDGNSGYDNTFFLVLENDYINLSQVFLSVEFQSLLDVINTDFQQNFNESGLYDVPVDYVLLTEPEITYLQEQSIDTFNVSPVLFTDTGNGDAVVEVPITFTIDSAFAIIDSINTGSVKTNRNYEVGIIYLDNKGRKSTVLTSNNNAIYVSQLYSIYQNKLVATINTPAPYWADRYKLVVKSNPLAYQTIYVTEFYAEDFYTWCKLEGANKDKVSEGDFLIIKKAGATVITEPIKVKVLEIKFQEKDFIELNQDDDGNDIVERSGTYMRIKPRNFSMDRDDFDVYVGESPEGSAGNNNRPVTYLDLFTELGPPLEELPIPAGTSITLNLHNWREYSCGWTNIYYNNQFFAQRNYDSLEEWFEEVIFSRASLLATEHTTGNCPPPVTPRDFLPWIEIVRGAYVSGPFGLIFNEDPSGKLYLKFTGLVEGGVGDRSRNTAEIIVRSGSGVYVFETLPKQADTDIFYETAQCFDIVGNNHLADASNIEDNTDQDITTGVPATVVMDFFNCYTQGQGIESFRVRDEFNTNYLTVDSRPTSTSVEEYREIRRFADMTYGKPFIESTNINGLNEFNLSTANFKELDKQYGSIQKTLEREGNLLVWQENEVGYVLFGKDLITSANGESVLTKIPEVLGQHVTYGGNNGVSKTPESIARNGNRFYWVNAIKGDVVRLSVDGVSPIIYGMSSEFRNLLIQNPTSKKIGAYDPYFERYVLSIEDEVAKTLNAYCGNIIQKTITEPFTFILNINFLLGETVLSFSVNSGEVNIIASYDGTDYIENNITNNANITIPRNDLTETQIEVTVTPVGDSATLQITNTCPTGIPLKVTSIVLADETDIGTTIINKYRWGASSYFSENHLFENFEISKFQTEEGLEGNLRFPERGSIVNIQSFKSSINTGKFNSENENKLGYLVTDQNYTESDISTILSQATFITVTETQLSLTDFINQGSFTFNRLNNNENLYLIWDYRDILPSVSCQSGVSENGNVGIYEITIVIGTGTGNTGINYNALSIPDRFQIEYDGIIVADSKYVGGGINGTPPGYNGLINTFNDLPVYEYDGANFVATGETRTIIVTQSDIANGTTEPTAGSGTLTFNKTTASPTTMKLIITGPVGGTGWNFTGICPPNL